MIEVDNLKQKFPSPNLWPRIIVDAMFGKLGRFLRILGFDVLLADSSWEDSRIMDLALRTKRILYTRDYPFYQVFRKNLINDGTREERKVFRESGKDNGIDAAINVNIDVDIDANIDVNADVDVDTGINRASVCYISEEHLIPQLVGVFKNLISLGYSELRPEHFLWDSKTPVPNLYKVLPFNPRCSNCNSTLKEIPKNEVKLKVNSGTFDHFDYFLQCKNPECGKIYWFGIHWAQILEKLEIITQIFKEKE
ncbi:MAG: Mut7-C RNAse domain-containing protein [Promethearchaeota archaeon]